MGSFANRDERQNAIEADVFYDFLKCLGAGLFNGAIMFLDTSFTALVKPIWPFLE